MDIAAKFRCPFCGKKPDDLQVIQIPLPGFGFIMEDVPLFIYYKCTSKVPTKATKIDCTSHCMIPADQFDDPSFKNLIKFTDQLCRKRERERKKDKGI